MRRILIIAAAVAAIAAGALAGTGASTDSYHDAGGQIARSYHDS